MKNILISMQGYHAWANSDLTNKLAKVDITNAAALEVALRLINHYNIVARIFRGHLVGTPHGFSGDNTPDTPTLKEMARQLHEIDGWYRGYLSKVTDAQLCEPIPFAFTDGDKGMMTRAEMVTHVILHGGYHRGEVGRLLWGLEITPPWDTYAVYLHQSEPKRREQRVALLS